MSNTGRPPLPGMSELGPDPGSNGQNAPDDRVSGDEPTTGARMRRLAPPREEAKAGPAWLDPSQAEAPELIDMPA